MEEEATDEIKAVQDELTKLHLLVDNAKAAQMGVRAHLENAATNLRELQAGVIESLEEAFLYARLIEADEEEPEIPVEELSVEGEYEKLCLALRGDTDADVEPVAPLRDFQAVAKRPSLSPEEQAQEDATDAYWTALYRLQAAEALFERKDTDRAVQWQEKYEAGARGEPVAEESAEAFDLRWLKRNQELTREFIEAEQAYVEAKAAAIAVGVDITVDDQVSGFLDNTGDGYPVGLEEEMVAVPLPGVSKWLTSISSPVSANFNDRVGEPDEWEANDIEVGESVSMVAEGRSRRRIEKWRQVCDL